MSGSLISLVIVSVTTIINLENRNKIKGMLGLIGKEREFVVVALFNSMACEWASLQDLLKLGA